MNQNIESKLKLLTGISKTEMKLNTKRSNPLELNLNYLRKDDILLYSNPESFEGDRFSIFTNFGPYEGDEFANDNEIVEYDIYRAVFDNENKLRWRDGYFKNTGPEGNPKLNSRRSYRLMGEGGFSKIDYEFMRTLIRGTLMNWNELPWRDLK